MATQTQALDRQNQARVTPHTVRVRRQQAIAKGAIWGAAGLAMAILVLIVGYIIFNGFYTRTVRDYPVTPYVEERITIADQVEMSIVVERSMRIRDVTYSTLREIFTGQLPYLGYLTAQNRRAEPIIYAGNGFADSVEEFVTPAGMDFGTYGANNRLVESVQAIEDAMRNEPGAIALVPASMAKEIGGAKVIGLRQASVVVNEQIMELQAGRRLSYLTEEQVAGLLSGEIGAWSDVGGPRVEIEPTDPQEEEPAAYQPLQPVPVLAKQQKLPWAYADDATSGRDIAFGPNAVRVDSLEAYAEMIRTTPGSIGIVRAKEALDLDLPIVPIEHVSHWLNLRPALLVEPPSRAGAVGGLSTIIINTLVMVAFVLLIAAPIGIAAAIYLVEYAKQSPLVNLLRLGTDTLAGIPSIIFGLFGLVFFSQMLGFQTGLISGTLTLTIMILPTIV
ncbi:MAG: hypothetical protein ACOCY8_07560, partial [Spirochaetota bacterium]